MMYGNRSTGTRARGDASSSCKLTACLKKFAFWLGLCSLICSTASSSIPPSEPHTYNEYKHDCNDARAKIIVDESEYDNTHDGYYDSVPWQTSPLISQSIDEAARYEDMPPTVFSPTGRLHPVEAAVRASKTVTPMSNVVLAMRCRDGLLVISTFPISPHVDARIAKCVPDATTSHKNTSIDETVDGIDDDVSVSKTNQTGNTSICNDDSFYPSLFLYDETCTSTMTGSIFDIHPCIVGATAGNAVDNRIMKTKLLALGLEAVENQGVLEEDVKVERLANDLADQLQIVTQDIAMAQEHNLGRLLASSAVILGNRKIWRIDPTGQFWDCHATIVGADADRTEEDFCCRLLEECKSRQLDNFEELMDSISQDEALAFVEDFFQTQMTKQQYTHFQHSNKPTKSSPSFAVSSAKESEHASETDLQSQLYWQAVILDFSSIKTRGKPRRKTKRGIFGVRSEPQ